MWFFSQSPVLKRQLLSISPLETLFINIQDFPNYYLTDQMTTIEAQLMALRQKHEFTVIELTDLKDDYEKIKKINNTIIENLVNKEPSDTLHEIKLIIDGTFHSQQIIELQAEIDRLNAHMNDQVDKRVKAITGKLNQGHDCPNCQKFKKIIDEKIEQLQRMFMELNQTKTDLQTIVNKRKVIQEKYANATKANEKLQQANRLLERKMKNMVDVKDVQSNLNLLDEEWQKRYDNLLTQYERIEEELLQGQERKENKGKQVVKKKIQYLIEQINNKKNKNNRISTSRLTDESDYSAFSIKDAINRPSQMF